MASTNIKVFNRSSKMLRLKDDKFTTSQLSISFISRLQKDISAKRALVSYILKDSCKKYPDITSLNAKLNHLYGAYLSVSVGKLGDCQTISFTINCINDRFVKGEALNKECIELLCSVLTEPNMQNGLFDKTTFETQKRCLIEEIQSEIAEKRYYAMNRCVRELLKGEPGGLHRLGSVEEIESIKYEELSDIWQQMLKDSGLFIFYATDTEQDIEQIIGSKINLYPQLDIDLSELCFNKANQVEHITEELAVNQAKLVLGLRTKEYPLSSDVYATKMMAALLGGTPSSLLFKNVREKLSLCYYCAARYDSLKGAVLIDSGLEEKNCETAQKEILKCLDMIREGNFTDDELEETRKAVINSYLTANDSQAALRGWYLSQSLLDEIISTEEAIELIRKVTRDDIIKAANSIELGTVYTLKPQQEQ